MTRARFSALRQVAEQLEDLPRRPGVEVRGRLVGEQDRRARRRGRGRWRPAASGRPRGRAAGNASGRRGRRRRAPARPRSRAARPFTPLDVERVLDVLERGQRGEEVELLEDEADRPPADRREAASGASGSTSSPSTTTRPERRREDAAEDREERRLAGARRPLERDDLAALQREGDAAQDRDGLPPFAKLLTTSATRGRSSGTPRTGTVSGREELLAVDVSRGRRAPGRSAATLRNETIAAARQSRSVPTKTIAGELAA